jgi:hypothetical protein
MLRTVQVGTIFTQGVLVKLIESTNFATVRIEGREVTGRLVDTI